MSVKAYSLVEDCAQRLNFPECDDVFLHAVLEAGAQDMIPPTAYARCLWNFWMTNNEVPEWVLDWMLTKMRRCHA